MNADHNIPWLRSGTGASPAEGGCILQVIDWLDRECWTDSPPCVHPVIARLAISANDRLPDGERQKLLDLAPRMMGTASDDQVLNVRLALVCAKVVLPLFEARHPDDDRPRKAIEAAETWCDCPCEEHAMKAWGTAHAAHSAAAVSVADYASDASAAYSASASAAASAHSAASYAAASAHSAASYAAKVYDLAAAYAAKVYDLLLATLAEYERITGRRQLPELNLAPVAVMLAEARA